MDDKLTTPDIDLLEWLLPKKKPFYRDMFERIGSLPVTSRREDGTITLGDFEDALSETIAVGEVGTESGIRSLSIAATDDRSAFALNFPAEKVTEHLWTLSAWNPDELSPSGNTVREIPFVRQEEGVQEAVYVLALSPIERVVWLHHSGNSYNQLLPVTGIFVELARLRGKQAERLQAERLSHEAFFSMAAEASDRDVTLSVLKYNKRAKKFDTEGITVGEKERRGIRSFFDRIRR